MKQISLEFNSALKELDMFQDSNLFYVNDLENAKKYNFTAVYFRFIKETQKYIP